MSFGEDRTNGWHGEDDAAELELAFGEVEGEGELDEAPHPPLTWRRLGPGERREWFERLWHAVCALQRRYRLAVRSGWWEDEVQLEALAALAAWVERYDSGDWDDPPGKLGLLFELERIAALLRDGLEPFRPERDWPRFVAHVRAVGERGEGEV